MSEKMYAVKNNTLHKGGSPAICPFKPPIPVPSPIQTGQMQLAAQCCTIDCAMCNILTDTDEKSENNGQLFVQLTCGCVAVGGYIDEPVNEQPKPKPILSAK